MSPSPAAERGPRTPWWRRAWVLAVAGVGLVGVVVAAVLVATSGPEVATLRYDQLLDRIDSRGIDTAELSVADGLVSGKLVDPDRGRTRYSATFPVADGDRLARSLASSGAEVKVDSGGSSFWEDFLINFLPVLAIIGAFLWFALSFQGGKGSRFGRAKAGSAKDGGSVTFADVAGADEAVEELREITEFLADPARFARMGARVPSGVLLHGPPGTGKTLLARAVAGEAKVPFLTISGSDFVEMFVGVGASRVRDLFRQAKEQAPAIVFVDEIDAVGRHRGAGVGGGHDEREQTLNQLLVEMDGFEPDSGVILMAATNRPDILDPALLRPGRFDRHIGVDAPDRSGRAAILALHARTKPLGPDVDLEVLARRTPGFTGADLENVLNEAAIVATRRSLAAIGTAEVTAAIDRVVAGPERRSRILTPHEQQVIAYHEAGHAVVGHHLASTDPVHRVSIVARGKALGWTLSLPSEDRYLHSASQLRDRMAMALAGRVAEELVFGEVTTGAADDIEKVSDMARAMVTRFGMADRIGPRRLGHDTDEPFLGREHTHHVDYSESVATLVDDAISELVSEAHHRARSMLEARRDTLDRLAARLVEVETVDEGELEEIFGVGSSGTGEGPGRSGDPTEQEG